MSTLEPEYEGDLAAACDRIGIPEEVRRGFRLRQIGDRLEIDLGDGRQIELGEAERVMNEGGMSEAIEKKLRATGFNGRPVTNRRSS